MDDNANMKKLLLSGFVVVTFILYSIQQRHDGTVAISTPASLTSNSQTQSSPTAAPPVTNQQAATYKDGVYTGDVADAYYGYVQVQATVRSGKITAIKFLQYPNDRGNSIAINQQAMPYLQQEAIQAQSSHVDIISGATDTSSAFIESLSAALSKAA